MNKSRSIIAAAIILILGGISSWFLVTASSPMLVSKPIIMINQNAGNMLPVYMTLENTGGPNRLLGVKSTDGKMTMLMGGSQAGGLAIPAGSRPSLSADGAHIMISGIDPKIAEGSFVPLILSFEEGGDVPVKAMIRRNKTEMDGMKMKESSESMSHGMHMSGRVMEVEPGQTVPELSLAVDAVGDKQEWSVIIKTQNFEFLRVEGLAEHKAGQGHAHLYLNGLKLQRMYGDRATIGALPAGTHVIKVALNTNDHRVYSVGGKAIEALLEIKVD